MKICFTPNSKNQHAYFPALMASFGVLDLFSGLLHGDLKKNGLSELKGYAKFLPTDYGEQALTVAWHSLRHKVAHMAHPYDVTDTDTITSRSGQKLIAGARMRITWSIDEKNINPAIVISALPKPEFLSTAPEGWNISYDNTIYVHLRSLQADIVDSVYAANGYLEALKSSETIQDKFEVCMSQYFPS